MQKNLVDEIYEHDFSSSLSLIATTTMKGNRPGHIIFCGRSILHISQIIMHATNMCMVFCCRCKKLSSYRTLRYLKYKSLLMLWKERVGWGLILYCKIHIFLNKFVIFFSKLEISEHKNVRNSHFLTTITKCKKSTWSSKTNTYLVNYRV